MRYLFCLLLLGLQNIYGVIPVEVSIYVCDSASLIFPNTTMFIADTATGVQTWGTHRHTNSVRGAVTGCASMSMSISGGNWDSGSNTFLAQGIGNSVGHTLPYTFWYSSDDPEDPASTYVMHDNSSFAGSNFTELNTDAVTQIGTMVPVGMVGTVYIYFVTSISKSDMLDSGSGKYESQHTISITAVMQ